jgi:uncharacterized protein (TIGR02145 family)
MKHHLVIRIILICLCYTNYAANAQSKAKTIQDKEGHTYTLQEMPGRLTWMTTNLKITVPESYCYFNADSNCEMYGRLYTWQAAEQGCKLLGKGWRLPTNAEWQKLAKAYGGIVGDSKDGGKTAHNALLVGGSSGFNAVWGGRRDANKQYWQKKIVGFYWTATESDSTHSWFYNFDRRAGTLNHYGDAEKNRSFSVRCVKGK